MKANQQESLAQQLEALKREKAPQRDLWPGIERAISQPPTVREKSRQKYYAMAASIFLAITVGVIGYQGGMYNSSNEMIVAMSTQHQKQVQELLVSYEGQQATADNWKTQLEQLDDAAEAIKKALEEDPGNPALVQMLRNVYQQQLLLIERVHSPKWQQI